jgi:hypothetical protein
MDERTAGLPQIFEAVRSKIVTTPAGERVLWGNRQTTQILESVLAAIKERQHNFNGVVLPVNLAEPVIQVIRNIRIPGLSESRHLSDLAANLESLATNAIGGVIGYVDADDTLTDAQVRTVEMHEVGVHIPQARIGNGTIKILPAAWMRSDPDYRQIGWSETGRPYLREPKRLAGEAAAYVLSGEWEKVGYTGANALERARDFGDRYLREVGKLYGVEAVKQFRDIHSEMLAVVERITDGNFDLSRKRQEGESRNRGGTGGRDEGGLAKHYRARPIGERERQDLGGRLRAGWGGSGEESARGTLFRTGKAEKASDWAINLPDFKTAEQPDFSFSAGISQPLQGENQFIETFTVSSKITTTETIEVAGERGSLPGRGQEPVSDSPSQGRAMSTDKEIPPLAAGDPPTPEELKFEMEQAKVHDAMVERAEQAALEFGVALAEAEGIAKAEAELRYKNEIQAEPAGVDAKQQMDVNDQSVPRFPFIEEALAEGANIAHLTIEADGTEWTVVSFKNAEGIFLLNGEDVYVTEASAEAVEAAIRTYPVTLPGLDDLELAGDIEIELPDISLSTVLDSMTSGNREVLEAALNRGAVIERFWSGPDGGSLAPDALLIVSFENDPNTYIFDNAGGTAERTGLDFGATRYAVDAGYEISDRATVREIEVEANQMQAEKVDNFISM